MVKKKGGGVLHTLKEGVESLSGMLFSFFSAKIDEEANVILHKVEGRVDVVSERLIKKLSTAILSGIGFLFLIIAGVSFLIEAQGYSYTQAFIVSGLIVIVLSILLKYYYLKAEKQN